MKTFVSALTLGLIVAFSAPAFAGTSNAPKQLNRARHPSSNRTQPKSNRRSLCIRSLHLTQPAAPLVGAVECAKGIRKSARRSERLTGCAIYGAVTNARSLSVLAVGGWGTVTTA